MKFKRLILRLLIMCLLVALMGCSEEEVQGAKKVKPNNNKYVDIYDVVKEAFITDKGYADDIAKHMSKEIFDKTNVYSIYKVNDPGNNKSFSVEEFRLKEVAQHKDNEKIIVDMNYSIKIIDVANKISGGSRDVPITFTVEKRNGDWFIVKKEEEI